MKRNLMICTIALCLGGVWGAAWGGDTKEADQKAMMAAMAKYSQPGEQHKWLQALVGSWNTKTRAWMGPGKPIESTGSAEIKPILGERG
jgi:hypothetical protein